MPEPGKGEDKETFIGRCIRYVRREGHSGDEAAGKCYGIWRHAKGEPEPKRKK